MKPPDKDRFKAPVPVIDLFAGPGGLSEGFSSFPLGSADPAFKVALSIEKEAAAHKTLELRAFFRQFQQEPVPPEYYEYLRGEISRESLFAKHEKQASQAKDEAWQATLGEQDHSEVVERIDGALGGAKKNWVLVGGPPCQAYSLVGRARRTGTPDDEFAKDGRHTLYLEYLKILHEHSPAVFIFENVKGLLSSKHAGDPIFKKILEDLSDPDRAVHGGVCWPSRSTAEGAATGNSGCGPRPPRRADRGGVPDLAKKTRFHSLVSVAESLKIGRPTGISLNTTPSLPYIAGCE